MTLNRLNKNVLYSVEVSNGKDKFKVVYCGAQKVLQYRAVTVIIYFFFYFTGYSLEILQGF